MLSSLLSEKFCQSHNVTRATHWNRSAHAPEHWPLCSIPSWRIWCSRPRSLASASASSWTARNWSRSTWTRTNKPPLNIRWAFVKQRRQEVKHCHRVACMTVNRLVNECLNIWHTAYAPLKLYKWARHCNGPIWYWKGHIYGKMGVRPNGQIGAFNCIANVLLVWSHLARSISVLKFGIHEIPSTTFLFFLIIWMKLSDIQDGNNYRNRRLLSRPLELQENSSISGH